MPSVLFGHFLKILQLPSGSGQKNLYGIAQCASASEGHFHRKAPTALQGYKLQPQMDNFAGTANVDYCSSFADPGKQSSVICFRLQQTNRSLHVPFSVGSKQTVVAVFFQFRFLYIQIYVHVYIYIHIHTHIYTYIHTYTFTNTYRYTSIYINRKYIYIHIHIHICICIYIYIYKGEHVALKSASPQFFFFSKAQLCSLHFKLLDTTLMATGILVVFSFFLVFGFYASCTMCITVQYDTVHYSTVHYGTVWYDLVSNY